MCTCVCRCTNPAGTYGDQRSTLSSCVALCLTTFKTCLYLFVLLSVYICSNTASQWKTSGVPFLTPSPTRISALHFPASCPASTQQPIHFYHVFFLKSPTKGKVNKWAKPFVITAPETLKSPTKQEITDGSAIPGGTYSRGNKWRSIDGLSDWACRQAPNTSAHKDFVYLFDMQWTLQILVGDIRLKSSNNVNLSRVKIKTTLL